MKENFKLLKEYKHLLTRQQIRTFKEQILAGNIKGFRIGLFKLIKKRKVE